MRDNLLTTNYFNALYEYADMITVFGENGEQKYPRYYIGSGEYMNIHDFDINGSGYMRKRSEVIVENDTPIQTTSCNDPGYIQMVYPMRLVCAVPKRFLSDDPFSADKLVFNLINTMNDTVYGVQANVKTQVTGFETNVANVLMDEIIGVETSINTNLVYLYIDFELYVSTLTNCLTDDYC